MLNLFAGACNGTLEAATWRGRGTFWATLLPVRNAGWWMLLRRYRLRSMLRTGELLHPAVNFCARRDFQRRFVVGLRSEETSATEVIASTKKRQVRPAGRAVAIRVRETRP
jgi:hypothetical protein